MSALRTIVRKIPGPGPGIFFFLMLLAPAAFAGTELDLAADLYGEGRWAEARTEALRAAAAPGPEAARARGLAAVCALKTGADPAAPQAELAALWRDETVDLETRCLAAFEAGRAGTGPEAVAALEFAYLQTRDVPLFWRAGCTLYFRMKADRNLRREQPALWQSLQSCRDAWPQEVWQECRPRKRTGPSLAALPGRWIVQVYRAQIGPAIGSRCDLHPSCSEYFLQAGRAHGLLGVPLIADRFVREPSVVAAAEKPVTLPGGRIRYADPVSAHDAWLKGSAR